MQPGCLKSKKKVQGCSAIQSFSFSIYEKGATTMCKVSMHWRNGCWVEAYFRKDGTRVARHWRNGTVVNDHCYI